jgi:hypothetical protein
LWRIGVGRISADDFRACSNSQTRSSRSTSRNACTEIAFCFQFLRDFMPKDTSSLDEEALPGLTKIETIDYRWLLSRSDKANDQQVARLLELKNKLFVAKLSQPQPARRSPPRWFRLIVIAFALLVLFECVWLLKGRYG